VTATTAPGAPIPAGRPRLAFVLSGLLLVMLLESLDQTIVSTALPTTSASSAA
jgi:hypothetical protein